MPRKKKTEEAPIQIPVFVTEETPVEEIVEEPPIEEVKDQPSEMTLNDILKLFESAYKGIPFRKTYYEIKNFDLGTNLTPTRTYREIGRMMFAELENYFNHKGDATNYEGRMKEITAALEEPMTEQKRHQLQARLDITAVALYRSQHEVDESMEVVAYLYNEFKKYPRFTRQDLESQEGKYHITKKIQEGNFEALHDIFINTPEETKTLIELVKPK